MVQYPKEVSGNWTRIEHKGGVGAPVNNAFLVQVRESGGQLCSVELDRLLGEVP